MWGIDTKSPHIFYSKYIIDMGDDGLKNNKYIWLAATTISIFTLGGIFILIQQQNKEEHAEVIYQEEQRQISSRMSNMMGDNQEADLKVVHQTDRKLLIPLFLNHLQKAKKM